MDAISGTRKKGIKGDGSKPRSGYLTTTEFARICGVSRFTIINWAKQGKIRANRTIGGHYRIPASEALFLLRTFDEKGKAGAFDLEDNYQPQKQKTGGDEECGNCLPDDRKSRHTKAKKKKFLYNFGYGIGRSVHILKEKRKGITCLRV